jgi:gamma-glutamyl hercynylcysteine S-oxide synthase
MNDRIHNARRETDDLFALVKTDALYDRPIPERHRIVFYIGHLEAFDWNLLSEPLRLEPFDPELDRLFAFGIDPVGGGLPTDSPSDWPSLATVLDYRDRVREKLDAAKPERAGRQLLHVAIEHRLMHAETLAYMLHQLPFDRKIPLDIARTTNGDEPTSESVEIPEGPATLGLPHDGHTFGWDNEFDAHTIHVPAFTIDRYKVTNAQFARFIDEGGYDHRPLWSDSDWYWKSQRGINSPIFWVRRNRAWLYRTMFADIPLPLHWPVYVSHAEASAYCRWAGKILPSESQWHRAAEGAGFVGQSGDLAWDPRPVSDCTSTPSMFGVEGIVGNGWEWTSTPFAPFEGFRPFPFYPGYSADFFDGKHYVMKGGSVRTAPCMLRPSFRNWFQTHYQYAYAGFRCVSHESEEPEI